MVKVLKRTRTKSLTENIFHVSILFLLFLWLLSFKIILSPGYNMANHYITLGEMLEDKGKIIFAAIVVVLLYTLSELPIFIVAMLVGKNTKLRYGSIAGIGIGLTIMAFSYLLLIYIDEYTFSLLTPFLVAFIYALFAIFYKIDESKYYYQTVILFQLLLGFQWFEINPRLHEWGFGKTETVKNIVTIIQELDGEHILYFISMIICLPYLLSGVVTILLLRTHLLRSIEIESSKMREKEYQQLRIEAVESRASQEMHTLVHDLKTPLTTIQGLISLLKIHLSSFPNRKLYNYSDKIDDSVSQLNEMISEILYEDVKRPISLQALLNYTKTQLDQKQGIQFIIEDKDKVININRVRVVRAIINLVQNAIEATEGKENPQIIVKIFYIRQKDLTAKEGAVISVIDNGDGIQMNHLNDVWKERFSTKGTSGLGLVFVKNVAKSHHGWVKVNSVLEKGSAIVLFLPKGEMEHHEKQEENINYR